MGFFSPELDACTRTTINLASNSCSTESFESTERSRSANHKGDEGIIYSKYSSDKKPQTIVTASVEGKKLPQSEHNQQPKILVADLMCPTCKQMLVHPVVLNCGHGS